MGQKINPNGFRLGVIRDWESKWYADKGYKETLKEDLQIRKFISEKLKDASVSTVEIERAANRINISIHTAKPGMVIGKGGSEVEALRKQLNALTGKQVHINIVEIKKPDLDADIDYAWVNAFTTYGEIGVQVWINRGEILPTRKNKPASKPAKGGNR